MKRFIFLVLLLLIVIAVHGQGNDTEVVEVLGCNCKVWAQPYVAYDSARWTGACKDSLATGKGKLVWYHQGKECAGFEGSLVNGLPEGQGKMRWGGSYHVEGNFRAGNYLQLGAKYLSQLRRQVISEDDTLDNYVSDHGRKTLFYDALVPKAALKGVLVLICGTWETVEDNLSSNQALIELAYDSGIAVIVPSVNQRLVLIPQVVEFYNAVFEDAIARYHLPREKFVIGGWSMGGVHSLRYGELANADSGRTAVVPKAVFSVDGPVDLETIYYNFKARAVKFPDRGEPKYGIVELEKYAGGNPANAHAQYVDCSNYSHNEANGGNARYLLTMPMRIYGDVDVNWWIDNRQVDVYDMNVLDQSAMVLWLQEHGNAKAEFINAYQKGYRLGGWRHPHSWSIVDAKEGIGWVLRCLE